MNEQIEYHMNKGSAAEIAEHLSSCDDSFVPPLSDRVSIGDYAKKIAGKATRIEAWAGGRLIGLVAAYCNDQEERVVYITSVSVLQEWQAKGIAGCLIGRCINHASALGRRQIRLEVAMDNVLAIKLYEKSGFVADGANTLFRIMTLHLENGEEDDGQP